MQNRWFARTGLALLMIAALSACGGGGGGSSTPAPTPTPAATVTLSDTNGDLSKFLGTWTSDCGVVIGSATSLLNTYTFTTINGSTVSGTITTTSFSTSLSCSGPSTQTVNAVAFVYVGPTTVVSTGAPDYAGTADRMTLVGVPIVVGFRDSFTKFIVANLSGVFSLANLTNTKR